jgi:hypothetical protein
LIYWLNHFQSVFFSSWTRAGLPDPAAYEEAYSEALQPLKFTWEIEREDVSAHKSLDSALLDAVYGFGFLMGELLGRLLGLPKHKAPERAQWCGRFNLGISLFDYLSDEGIGAETVAILPAFSVFLSREQPSSINGKFFSPPEKLLNQIASSVLSDLEKEIGAPTRTRLKSGLWRAMREMFRAEMLIATTPLTSEVDPNLIRKSLYLKSVEPFKVMAEWMSHGIVVNNRQSQQSHIKQARRLGRALGRCCWLVDDAKDVWRDLEAKQWNLFLVAAATEEPQLFNPLVTDALRDVRLMKIWKQTRIAERTSISTIRQLVRAVDELNLSKGKQNDMLGLLAAVLARWLQS